MSIIIHAKEINAANSVTGPSEVMSLAKIAQSKSVSLGSVPLTPITQPKTVPLTPIAPPNIVPLTPITAPSDDFFKDMPEEIRNKILEFYQQFANGADRSWEDILRMVHQELETEDILRMVQELKTPEGEPYFDTVVDFQKVALIYVIDQTPGTDIETPSLKKSLLTAFNGLLRTEMLSHRAIQSIINPTRENGGEDMFGRTNPFEDAWDKW